MEKPIVHAFELAIGLLMLIFCIGFWLNQPYQTERALEAFEFKKRTPQEVLRIKSSSSGGEYNTTQENYSGNLSELNLIMTGEELNTILRFQDLDQSYEIESRNRQLRNLDSNAGQQQDLIYYYKNEKIGLSRREVISKIVKGEHYFMTYEMDANHRIISIRIMQSNMKQ